MFIASILTTPDYLSGCIATASTRASFLSIFCYAPFEYPIQILPKVIHLEKPFFAARREETGDNKGLVEDDWASYLKRPACKVIFQVL